MEETEIIQKVTYLLDQPRKYRWFWENIVLYSEWYFYKIPSRMGKIFFYGIKRAYIDLMASKTLIDQYFGSEFVIAETEIYRYQWDSYIIRQAAITGKMLNKKELQSNKVLRIKFDRLIEINEQLWHDHGKYLDILGTDFIGNIDHIHNLMMSGDDIILFDFWLLDTHARNPFFRVLSRIFYRLQSRILHHFYR